MKAGQKHNKILWSLETDRPWTDRTEQYATKESVLNEIDKEGTFAQGLKNCKGNYLKDNYKKSKGKYLKILTTLKAWLLYEFPFSLNTGDKPNDAQA